jgi:GT2 family glycosyltransferase
MSAGAVAVVLCTRDRPHFLRDAIPAVQAALRTGDEFVVVDSASRASETREVAEALGVGVVRCDEPGASRARNAGAAATSCEVIAFTDDDCAPAADWLDAVASSFAADETLGFVTGQVLPDEEGTAVSVITDEDALRFRAGDDVAGMGHGANLAVRRSAFEAVGGFDEVLGAGGPLRACEDKDLLWRILDAGWAGAYAPTARVVHRQWRAPRELLRLEFSYGIGGGAFAMKHARSGDGLADLRRLLLVDAGHALGFALRGRRWAAASVGMRVAGSYVGALSCWRYRIAGGRFTRRSG